MPTKAGSPTELFHRLLSPRVVALITALRDDGKPNTMVAAWHSPISISPPVVAVAISPLRYTHKLILEKSEFTIRIPPKTMLSQVEEAGSLSGKEGDKSGIFQYVPAKKVKASVIKGSLGNIECSLNKAIRVGDHSVFFGNVLYSNSESMKEVWAPSPLLHLGSRFYAEFTLLKTA
jgi:flavin reductase (DIM6/NTAB) family NADH-FMN oxidoreductase RutF